MKREIRIKRAYEPVRREDGTRVLVDRLWPRGLRREDLALHGWMKEVAPSPDLRKWFNHDPERWEEFRRLYKAELHENTQNLATLLQTGKTGRLTLLYAARSEAHNHAVVLAEYLHQIS